jgi:Fe2+ or Zn2+ uptake regulation protein
MQMQIFAEIMKITRLTSARKAILDVLNHSDGHLSPTQIHKKLRDRLPSLNLSTVYRSLDYLVQHNLISITDTGTGSPVYELLEDIPHHHLICQVCGNMMNLDHLVVEPFFSLVEENNDFIIATNHLVLYGTCKKCKSIENYQYKE